MNHMQWETEQGKKLISMLPRRRVGSPADLDVVLMMLCANESHFVNGAVIQADDGLRAVVEPGGASLRSLPPEGARPALGRPGDRPADSQR
jgi:hypothetical protein